MNIRSTFLLVGLSLAPLVAAAVDVRISGFGQFVVSDPGGDGPYPFLFYPDQDVDLNQESLFGVQVSADINPQWTATAQIIARGADDWDPEFAWAYLAWQATDHLNVKVGRQRIPFFSTSDYLDVGYAYTAVRPSRAVYNLQFSDIDAVSANWTGYTGRWEHSALAMAGQFSGDLLLAGNLVPGKLDRMAFVAWEEAYDNWLFLRLSYGRGDVTLTSPQVEPLFDALGSLGLVDLRERLDLAEDAVSFTGIAARVERGAWSVGAEVTRIGFDQAYAEQRDNWLAFATWRIGAVQPFVTYGGRRAHVSEHLIAGLPAGLAPQLVAGISGLVRSETTDDRYASVGLRWDFMSNVAAKFEWTTYRSEVTGVADAELVSAALVFIF